MVIKGGLYKGFTSAVAYKALPPHRDRIGIRITASCKSKRVS
jgi:hypothetical protein